MGSIECVSAPEALQPATLIAILLFRHVAGIVPSRQLSSLTEYRLVPAKLHHTSERAKSASQASYCFNSISPSLNMVSRLCWFDSTILLHGYVSVQPLGFEQNLFGVCISGLRSVVFWGQKKLGTLRPQMLIPISDTDRVGRLSASGSYYANCFTVIAECAHTISIANSCIMPLSSTQISITSGLCTYCSRQVLSEASEP